MYYLRSPYTNCKGYVGVVFRSSSEDSFEFQFFLSNFEKVLSYTASFKSLVTIILGDFNVRSSVFWTRENTITEEIQLESFTTVPGFHQLISQPTYLLPQNSS